MSCSAEKKLQLNATSAIGKNQHVVSQFVFAAVTRFRFSKHVGSKTSRYWRKEDSFAVCIAHSEVPPFVKNQSRIQRSCEGVAACVKVLSLVTCNLNLMAYNTSAHHPLSTRKLESHPEKGTKRKRGEESTRLCSCPNQRAAHKLQ